MFSDRNYARRLKAKALREQAAQLAFDRSHPERIPNGEEEAFGSGQVEGGHQVGCGGEEKRRDQGACKSVSRAEEERGRSKCNRIKEEIS